MLNFSYNTRVAFLRGYLTNEQRDKCALSGYSVFIVYFTLYCLHYSIGLLGGQVGTRYSLSLCVLCNLVLFLCRISIVFD